MTEILFVIAVLNLLSFGLFGYDKFLAKKHRRRVSENTLLCSTFFGGTIGAVAGMFIFRHKISKNSFLWKFGMIILFQIVLVLFIKYKILNMKMC
ncbi:Uncharacterized membrane protein YsdA, DUF1294 family [Chryseobacterium arachidis]|uniref:Uncharacterized membrane protein YsdA, DUF1294 family n=1 Tax=Chryseobacterium arachidis TaxID=1416778 RepID=A0A1M5BQV9_9FLAO|nr:DUF1294 domain-containing protein [Chryseobacterium arachidis]SHF44617.1 Uncharacterized membrane protein YsdA, DUF1294 family [Chryseobacterium arachidis]